MPNRKYLGVTISTKQEQWPIPEIPFYCHVGAKQHYPHAQNRSRVEFLTRERNEAMARALELHPKTTHIVNVESNYLSQRKAIGRLISKYEMIDDDIILGAGTWAKMQDTILRCYQFYDGWATPEMYYYRYYLRRPHGLVQVSSAGSCLIFPSEIWKEYRFGIPEPFPTAGIYYNWLCEKSQLPVLLDLDIRFFRDYTNSDLIPYHRPWRRVRTTFWKPLRQRLIGRRLIRHRSNQ